MRALPLPLPATCDTTDVNLSTPAYTSCHRRGVRCRPSTFGSVLISLACAFTTHRFVRGARALPGGGTRGRSGSSSLVIDRCVNVLTDESDEAQPETLCVVFGKSLSGPTRVSAERRATRRATAFVEPAAGVVALVAGMMWGARAGVQFALVDLALKALPVLIIGGFSSIPGAIVGGLIIGATEKVLEVYVGPFFGGAIEGWAPYVLAIFFLLYRPEGLFGEKIIRRV